MSQLNSADKPKQSTNIYTTMLILSFINVAIACVLLYMELSSYGDFPWWKP